VAGTYLRSPSGIPTPGRGSYYPYSSGYYYGYHYPYHHPYYHCGSRWSLNFGFGYGYWGFSYGYGCGYYPGYRYYRCYPYWYWCGYGYRPYYHASYWPYWYTGTVVYYRDYYPYDSYDSGSTVVYNYYNYAEEDPAPVVAEEAVAKPDGPAREQGAQEDAFLESLSPAELSFVTGLVSFRGGEYEQAAEAWYTSSLKSPDAVAPRAFLVVGLFALGEYQRAADYINNVLKQEPGFAAYRWDLRRVYGQSNAAAVDRHLATLKSYVELYPNRVDGHLVQGFVYAALGDRTKAADAFRAALSLDKEATAAQAFLTAMAAREKEGPAGPATIDEFQTFLNTLRLEDVKRLEL
jgi:tetratricopeptide (TPR) repeat protein